MKQKIALITGANKGIGQAIAQKLAEQEIFIIGTSTTPEGVAEINRNLETLGLSGQGRVLNVMHHESIKQLISDITAHIGLITILINNAGITDDNLFLRMKEEQWTTVMDTNLNATFYTTQLCLNHMLKAHWGRIINISSVVAFTGNPGQVNYCASKAGLIGLTRALAQEVAAKNITVNAIAPGFIETSMTHRLKDQQKTELLKKIPMGRPGKPQDIAEAVSFLVSEEANYMTGQTLHINGGLYAG